MEFNIGLLKTQAEKEIGSAESLKELDAIFKKFLGKKGEITQILRLIEGQPDEEKAKTGKEVNELKKFLEEKIKEKKSSFAKATEDKEDWFDITVPAKKLALGHLHPLTLVRRKIVEIFQSMGFSVVDGPEIETEWYNFDALNIPKGHPARDALSLGKTFYLKEGGLLRSQTSGIQIRYMEKNNPPLRIIAPGKIFRCEATDVSHEFQLFHVEALAVAPDVSVANFKAIISEFFKRFFEKDVKIRLRPSYFPFTEPSFEIDINCLACGGNGCPVCKRSGWIEMLGAGMVHPNIFKNSGLTPFSPRGKWQGFAFALGMDRLAMMKYKINDIRLFHSGDLRFLEQF